MIRKPLAVVRPRYRAQRKEWFVIPNFMWLALVVISIASIIYYQNAWCIAGIIIGLYSSAKLGSRSGNIDGFQIGYECGKEQAIMQVYKLSPEQLWKSQNETNMGKVYN